jgi:manganese transport protein
MNSHAVAEVVRGPAAPSAAARQRQVPRMSSMLGPAFVAAIAYVDPGNVATNFTAGATTGYMLLWVVVAASLIAILVQFQAAKLGIATGKSLPTLCRERFAGRGNLLLWAQAEIVVLATDVAEFTGAAIGMQLLFGMPVALSAAVTAAVSLLLLELRRRGRTRPFELMSAVALILVGTGVGYDIVCVGHQSASGFAGGLAPGFAGGHSLILAMGIVGATVMPHAIYLHSGIVQGRGWTPKAATRSPSLVRRALRTDCLLGLGAATLVNTSMIAFGVGLASATGGAWTGDLLGAHAELTRRIGGAAALAFAIALLSSGVSSCGVGTLAGDIVMRGFLGRGLPLHLRRLVTMAPAVLALVLGVPVTKLLILSQVVISLGVPVALFLLVHFCRDRSVMGPLVNAPLTTRLAGCSGAVVAALGCYLAITLL